MCHFYTDKNYETKIECGDVTDSLIQIYLSE